MDMIWDQDVRTALSAIISRHPFEQDITGSTVATHIQLAIKYADELNKARAVLERKPPVSNYRPGRLR